MSPGPSPSSVGNQATSSLNRSSAARRLDQRCRSPTSPKVGGDRSSQGRAVSLRVARCVGRRGASRSPWASGRRACRRRGQPSRPGERRPSRTGPTNPRGSQEASAPASADQCSPVSCGGSAATSEWSLSMSPSFEAPPGIPDHRRTQRWPGCIPSTGPGRRPRRRSLRRGTPGSQAPQSTHSSGWMYSIRSPS